ncbi:MAG: sugar phosphate isomerase/epimerase [Vicinamibacterales bacterium]
MSITRRAFTSTVALTLASQALPAWARRLNIPVGHTGITWPWGNAPRGTPGPTRLTGPEPIEEVVRDIASLGYRGIELFAWQIDGMEAYGGLGPVLQRHKLALVASYTGVNLTDSAQRQATIASAVATGKIVKKLGGTVMVIGPNGVPRDTYNFAANKANIVTTLNEVGKAISDLGLTAALHQHTGTCVETRDETYAVMEAVDTTYMKFGPDIGQLQKGGADPVQVVKDFLPIVQHMHLKDFSGGDAFLGYCPLGQGKVDLPAILSMMDGKKMNGMVMVELDSSPGQPIPPKETATIAKAYLQKHGVSLRS